MVKRVSTESQGIVTLLLDAPQDLLRFLGDGPDCLFALVYLANELGGNRVLHPANENMLALTPLGHNPFTPPLPLYLFGPRDYKLHIIGAPRIKQAHLNGDSSPSKTTRGEVVVLVNLVPTEIFLLKRRSLMEPPSSSVRKWFYLFLPHIGGAESSDDITSSG
ncbi:hypothetical protein LWI28_009747 [Acer negundo]|uniref:Uncharacterized protein n=1 Tax=Acer negundo TaxID=4023 RepID=A0AAD5P428_ACENE|nr:hypothetical protein LWI28_009747 [Acer negundo]